MVANRKLTFEQWVASVDAMVLLNTGLSTDDLPDCPYHDWYDDGVSVKSAAKRAICQDQD